MLFKRKRTYLDYAAATPVRPEVRKAMARYEADDFANPSAIHAEGQRAKAAVAAAREHVARTLRVRPADIVFTSGGTESNNLALRGSVKALMESGRKPEDIEIISLPTEHPSITSTLAELKQAGVRVVSAPIDADGLVILPAFTALLSSRTHLVTVALANSETGVIQDIARIGRAIKAFEKETGSTILFHTDASQAPLWVPCALDALFVDLMTLDAGKCCGPKGVGVLVRRPRARLTPFSTGGPQEAGLRPGTEPTSLIVGAATALVLAQAEAVALSQKVGALRDRFIRELLTIPGTVLNGSATNRLANNVNISVLGLDTEYAVVALDQKGIAASTKSACSGAGSGRSVVVATMTGDDRRARSTIRFTLGPETTWKDLRRTVIALREHRQLMDGFAFDLK